MNKTHKKTYPASHAVPPMTKNKKSQRDSADPEIAELNRTKPNSEKALKQELNQRTRECSQIKKELKQAQAEFKKIDKIHQQKNDLLEAIIANAGGPVFSVDRRYCYTSFNQPHAEVMKSLFGADIKIGQNLLDYHTNPVDRLEAKKNLDQAFCGETVIVESYAGAVIRSRRYFEIVHQPIRAYNNNVVGASVYARDITDHKRTESELARQNQKINEILTSIQDDFYVLDRDWNFVYTNRQFTTKIGKEPEDFLGKNIWKMFPKHVGTVFEENFRAAMEKRQIRRFEISGKYTDAWYSMTVFPSADGITVLGTNISERKRAEKALQESEERFRLALRNAPVTVAVQDCDLRFQWAYNQRSVDPTAIIGKLDTDLFPPEDAARLIALKRKVLETEKEVSEQLWINSAGRRFFLDLHLEPLRDASGRVSGIGLASVDLTPMKLAEQDLLQARNELETRVRERERLLLQIEEQKRQAEAMADEAEKHQAEIEAVFNALTDSIIVYGPDEVALRANAAAKTMLGFDPIGVDLAKNMVTAGTKGGPRASVTARALRGEPVTEADRIGHLHTHAGHARANHRRGHSIPGYHGTQTGGGNARLAGLLSGEEPQSGCGNGAGR
jgi:PAS domain S-box-containing protein